MELTNHSFAIGEGMFIPNDHLNDFIPLLFRESKVEVKFSDRGQKCFTIVFIQSGINQVYIGL